MKKILVVVDMQKDFVDGALGTEEAKKIVPAVVGKINSFDGEIIVTYDTHSENYLNTSEGEKLPVEHCIKGTAGWSIDSEVQSALENKKYCTVEKLTFGSVELPAVVGEITKGEEFSIELVGLCTDICVVSNALILKASYPEVPITVDSSRCAGVTPETHEAALTTMKMCQINVI